MILFEVDDLEDVQRGRTKTGQVGGGLHEVPRASETFPGGGVVDEYVDFESRILERVEVFGQGVEQSGFAGEFFLFLFFGSVLCYVRDREGASDARIYMYVEDAN